MNPFSFGLIELGDPYPTALLIRGFSVLVPDLDGTPLAVAILVSVPHWIFAKVI